LSNEFLNSLVKKEDKAKEALIYLYQEVRKTNEFLGLKNSPELKTTYFNLRKEEIGELFKAIEQQDRVEFLDAVVDGLVVVGYEYYLNDQKPDDVLEEYATIYYDMCDRYTVQEDIKDLLEYYDKEQGYEETLGTLEPLFSRLNINHMQAVKEVVDSNLSKFPTVEDFQSQLKLQRSMYVDTYTLQDLCEYQSYLIRVKGGRYTGVYHEIRKDVEGNDRIIWWATGENKPDGFHLEYKSPKYVKPCTFKNPDFKSCWLD